MSRISSWERDLKGLIIFKKKQKNFRKHICFLGLLFRNLLWIYQLVARNTLVWLYRKQVRSSHHQSPMILTRYWQSFYHHRHPEKKSKKNLVFKENWSVIWLPPLLVFRTIRKLLFYWLALWIIIGKFIRKWFLF